MTFLIFPFHHLLICVFIQRHAHCNLAGCFQFIHDFQNVKNDKNDIVKTENLNFEIYGMEFLDPLFISLGMYE